MTTLANSDGEATYGYLVEGSNGNSIFLPAAGYCTGSTPSLDGTNGHYWSSTPNADDSDNAYAIGLGSSGYGVYDDYSRYYGRSVRPVSE